MSSVSSESTSEEDSLGLLPEEYLGSAWDEPATENLICDLKNLRFDADPNISPINVNEKKSRVDLQLLESTPKIKHSAQEIIDETNYISVKENLNKTVRISSTGSHSPQEEVEDLNLESMLNATHNIQFEENSLNRTFKKENLLNITFPTVNVDDTNLNNEVLYDNQRNVQNNTFTADVIDETRPYEYEIANEEVSSEKLLLCTITKENRKNNEIFDVKEINEQNKTFTEDICEETESYCYQSTDEESSKKILSRTVTKVKNKKRIEKKPYSSWTTLDCTTSSLVTTTSYPPSSTPESNYINTGTKKKVFKTDTKKKFIKSSNKEKPRKILSSANRDLKNLTGSSSAMEDEILISSEHSDPIISPPSSAEKSKTAEETGFFWLPESPVRKSVSPRKSPPDLSFRKMPKEEMSQTEKDQIRRSEILLKNENYLKKKDKEIRACQRHYDHKLSSYIGLKEVKEAKNKRERIEIPTIRLSAEPNQEKRRDQKKESKNIPAVRFIADPNKEKRRDQREGARNVPAVRFIAEPNQVIRRDQREGARNIPAIRFIAEPNQEKRRDQREGAKILQRSSHIPRPLIRSEGQRIPVPERLPVPTRKSLLPLPLGMPREGQRIPVPERLPVPRYSSGRGSPRVSTVVPRAFGPQAIFTTEDPFNPPVRGRSSIPKKSETKKRSLPK